MIDKLELILNNLFFAIFDTNIRKKSIAFHSSILDFLFNSTIN